MSARTTAGACAGLMLGVVIGLVAFGDQLLMPLAPTVLLSVLGGCAASWLSRPPRPARPLDPARMERRNAAHRAMAELNAAR